MSVLFQVQTSSPLGSFWTRLRLLFFPWIAIECLVQVDKEMEIQETHIRAWPLSTKEGKAFKDLAVTIGKPTPGQLAN